VRVTTFPSHGQENDALRDLTASRLAGRNDTTPLSGCLFEGVICGQLKGLSEKVHTFRVRGDRTAPYRLVMRSPLHQSQPLARETCG
jgi:hypothetical protein